MSAWHHPMDGICHVCLAGAIMANTLRVPIEKFFNSVIISDNLSSWRQLYAIDSLRNGDVESALDEMQIDYIITDYDLKSFHVVKYENNKDEFKADMTRLMKNLKELDL